ncbi:tRNA uridine(34) 5-carboxymethylaminomethyl modification radical SAM/GNAT enzyme Elp3 [Patescibacteria group bacterium]|nr:tRNA uridine(34) 5-carboxymethylaminomethyl modification radical SAM/GNAT enzyme Elp3 [Patescibacteria group bacterium]
MNINQYIINELIEKVSVRKRQLSSEYLSKLKRKASKEYKMPCPTNIELLQSYREMAKDNSLKEIENVLMTKNIRTSSGVAVIAVLTKPYPCPGKCKFCPSEKDMPKSYLSNEPAVMRAVLTDFHPRKQVEARINSLMATGHKTDKIELIVMGGTFSYLPKRYQTWFIKECFKACNKFNEKDNSKNKSKNLLLESLQKENETSNHRIVGLTLETRPDYIDEKEILRMRKLGATRVELGVQTIYDDVFKLNARGHNSKEVITATKLLKEAGFKINYHMMPNLPGSNYKRDLKMFQELFSNPDFQPDMLKIYPCVVVKDAEIFKWWKTGKYKPYSDKKLVQLLCEIKKNIPYYVRITRLIRDIPSTSIVAGNKISNLRQTLEKRSVEENWKCKCIRCREVRNKNQEMQKLSFRAVRGKSKIIETAKINNLKLFRQGYNASNGKEIFLSFEDEKRQHIYSLLRLRINSGPQSLERKAYRLKPELQAIIREVHTYGQLVSIKSKNINHTQHTGLGKKLIQEAERITEKEFGLKKIAVISGVGVRDYYRKLGYRLEDGYMVKKIINNNYRG